MGDKSLVVVGVDGPRHPSRRPSGQRIMSASSTDLYASWPPGNNPAASGLEVVNPAGRRLSRPRCLRRHVARLGKYALRIVQLWWSTRTCLIKSANVDFR